VAGQSGSNGTHGAKEIAADPAPRSDSESDAFSTTGAVVFRTGHLDARFGRQVKTVRPRLNLAGQYDLWSLPSPSVVMKVRADETGRVRSVEIIKSSGSNEVDQPAKLAMYEWWFEPPKDPAGNPQPAEMTWTISWQR
jgi:TonB family protein